MKVLEEFWYGNINPMERPFQSQRKFDKVFKLLTKNEEELLKDLNEQEKESFTIPKLPHRLDVDIHIVSQITKW